MRTPMDGCEKNTDTITGTGAIEPCSTPSSWAVHSARADGRAQEKIAGRYAHATASDRLA